MALARNNTLFACHVCQVILTASLKSLTLSIGLANADETFAAFRASARSFRISLALAVMVLSWCSGTLSSIFDGNNEVLSSVLDPYNIGFGQTDK